MLPTTPFNSTPLTSRGVRSDSSQRCASVRNAVLRACHSASVRSEEHTSELQSHHDLVCRLLLEKKKNMKVRHSERAEQLMHGGDYTHAQCLGDAYLFFVDTSAGRAYRAQYLCTPLHRLRPLSQN